jgi:hypothetical protein
MVGVGEEGIKSKENMHLVTGTLSLLERKVMVTQK